MYGPQSTGAQLGSSTGSKRGDPPRREGVGYPQAKPPAATRVPLSVNLLRPGIFPEKIMETQSGMHTVSKVCRPDVVPSRGPEPLCEGCGQVHLRSGYCQAADPLSPWHTSQLGLLWRAKHPVSVATDDNATLTATLSLDATLKTCEQCGVEFAPARSTARYCSSTCRSRSSRH